MHTSIHSEVAKVIRHPHAMVYGLWRALPGDRALLPPSPAEVAFHRLDAGVEASGPHVFTVRFSAVRYRHFSVHRIPPRVRDDREPPLRWDGTAAISEVIWVGWEAELFLRWGLDRTTKSARAKDATRMDRSITRGNETLWLRPRLRLRSTLATGLSHPAKKPRCISAARLPRG